MEQKTYFAQDSRGNVLYAPTVTVYVAGTNKGTLASGLKRADGVTNLSNPFAGGIDGLVAFRAPNGSYDIEFTSDERTYTVENVEFIDVQEQLDLIQATKRQTESLKDAVDAALVNAQAIVVSGDVALVPTAGQVPLGRSDGCGKGRGDSIIIGAVSVVCGVNGIIPIVNSF